MSTGRSSWGSNGGFLLAAIGSAIGLGNVWRFSYMAYQYGGGAFLVPYVVALFVAGIPIIIIEYGLGHKEKGSSPLSFARIGRRFEWLGWWMPVVAMFGIMLYYSVVIGWCINYLVFSFHLDWGSDPQGFFFKQFLQISPSAAVIGGIRLPIALSTFLVWVSCWLICSRDIRHGIERASVVFMPVLFLLTIILVLWSLSLDGARDAIMNHYLHADWSKINIFAADPAVRGDAGKVWAAAFGQIFFTLSLGFGIMITYASYLPAKSDIGKNALVTTLVNCLYSFVAGFAVFGVVGFMAKHQGVAFGEAIKGGPQLAFVVYPKAISLLPSMNVLFGVIFFLMLIIAGLTSGVSLVEAFVCAITDKFDWPRGKVVFLVCLAGFLGSLIFTSRGGLYFLDIADHFITNYGLVIGGLLECLIVGWVLKASLLRAHINRLGTRIPALWDFFIRYSTPAILAYLLYLSLTADLGRHYGGYPAGQLIIYGVGWMLVCLVLALVLAFCPWRAGKLKRRHRPEEDKLLV
ncbi:Sodium-dependent transporter, SNF family [hydrothermal vent metagenome]|uniref:Sodium-dependent transporter, SNF family n=1 Tax=hydrothermal vent metagenome TaxID=652676 RepID=A0A3B0VWA4_9ZZZZ